ncbi:YcdB/YcdC domain-containing protein [Brevibacillus laterosporus]|uniref:YcdB/YcdC domain-containing protein n=1 Tax=Brevibacillus laterosporus TaxID=1465 RepID=UPI0003B1C4F1|nr:YcdB/YcdC domain-containing protein [Brevibacillus laterosporus]ERM17224.1 hypothetical protein P615_21850 [Brevibacillus laterosporus PE36]
MKKSTNKTVLSLMAALMLSSTPVWASAKTISEEPEKIQTIQELDQVVKKSIKQLTEILPELKELTRIEVLPYSEGKTRVVLSKEKGMKFPSADIIIDSKSGVIQEFDIRKKDVYSDEPANKEMAKEKGEAFLKKLLGDRADQYKVREKIGTGGGDGTTDRHAWINISFNRVIDDIELKDDQYYLQINPNGDIIGMEKRNATSSDEELPKPEKLISKKQVEETLSKMIFSYISADDGRVVYLFNSTPYVNAETGEKIGTFQDTFYSDAYPANASGKKLVAHTPDEAAEILQSVLGFDVKGLTLAEEPDKDTLVYTWYKKDEAVAMVKTKDDQVLSVVIDDENKDDEKAAISPEKGQELAVKTLQKYLGDDVKELINKSWKTNKGPGIVIHYKIHQAHEGILVSDRTYSVTVNRATGKVTAIRGLGTTSDKLPDKDSIIDPETATKALLKETPLTLVYITAKTTGNEGDAYLAYTVDRDVRINGITGEREEE